MHSGSSYFQAIGSTVLCCLCYGRILQTAGTIVLLYVFASLWSEDRKFTSTNFGVTRMFTGGSWYFQT